VGKKSKMQIAILSAAVMLVLSTGAYAISPEKVIPMGDTVGIDFQTKGVIIEDMNSYTDDSGKTVSPCADAGLKVGDVIFAINEIEISDPESIKTAISGCNGKAISLTVERNGTMQKYSVLPYKNAKGAYELGLWLKNGVTGLGTLTFYDGESGLYGALGHPVSDENSGKPIEVKEGTLYSAEVTGIEKGKTGTPGRLNGSIDGENSIGSVEKNSVYGIYGKLDASSVDSMGEYIPVAEEDEIELGTAQIICSVSGEKERYDAEILRIYNGSASEGKTVMIKVTDERLLSLTGGIVQGMSGSPIIQNGKLIGAVTHVLVSDPTRGYGIGIEKMLEAAG